MGRLELHFEEICRAWDMRKTGIIALFSTDGVWLGIDWGGKS
jgi:hypothetical protein